MTCGAAIGTIQLTASRRMDQLTILKSLPRRQVHSLIRRSSNYRWPESAVTRTGRL